MEEKDLEKRIVKAFGDNYVKTGKKLKILSQDAADFLDNVKISNYGFESNERSYSVMYDKEKKMLQFLSYKNGDGVSFTFDLNKEEV